MHPLNRRISRALAVAAVVLFTLAVGSLFIGADIAGRVGVVSGFAYAFTERMDSSAYAVWFVNPRRTMPQRLGDAVGLPCVRRTSAGAIDAVEVPLVWPAALCAVAAYVVRRRGRIPAGHCMCGYDLRGNTSGVCPECGRKV